MLRPLNCAERNRQLGMNIGTHTIVPARELKCCLKIMTL